MLRHDHPGDITKFSKARILTRDHHESIRYRRRWTRVCFMLVTHMTLREIPPLSDFPELAGSDPNENKKPPSVVAVAES